MKYLIAEKFKSVQGEGVYAGTPMAFIRFVGCSVGKKICSACDTDFEEPVGWRGGGEFTWGDLVRWAVPYAHICFTGGEPMDQEFLPDLMREFVSAYDDMHQQLQFHVETSGTKSTGPICDVSDGSFGREGAYAQLWVCVSPKPGFLESEILNADEVKVIMPGLGSMKYGNPLPILKPGIVTTDVPPDPDIIYNRWPTLQDALRWAEAGKTVFIQPRNERSEVNWTNLRLCQDIVAEHPQLRLSMQLHKLLHVQ